MEELVTPNGRFQFVGFVVDQTLRGYVTSPNTDPYATDILNILKKTVLAWNCRNTTLAATTRDDDIILELAISVDQTLTLQFKLVLTLSFKGTEVDSVNVTWVKFRVTDGYVTKRFRSIYGILQVEDVNGSFVLQTGPAWDGFLTNLRADR